AVVVVEGVVDVRADAAGHAPVAQRQQVLGLAVVKEDVQPAVEEQAPLQAQRWDPARVVSMQGEGEVDEPRQIAPARHRSDLDSHPEPPYMRTTTDVFAKVREHERGPVLAAAREAGILPYFHLLSSPAMPVVEMEGGERIML